MPGCSRVLCSRRGCHRGCHVPRFAGGSPVVRLPLLLMPSRPVSRSGRERVSGLGRPAHAASLRHLAAHFGTDGFVHSGLHGGIRPVFLRLDVGAVQRCKTGPIGKGVWFGTAACGTLCFYRPLAVDHLIEVKLDGLPASGHLDVILLQALHQVLLFGRPVGGQGGKDVPFLVLVMGGRRDVEISDHIAGGLLRGFTAPRFGKSCREAFEQTQHAFGVAVAGGEHLERLVEADGGSGTGNE
ncbi:protein of unknown function [Paraburkholderia kururiensis]